MDQFFPARAVVAVNNAYGLTLAYLKALVDTRFQRAGDCKVDFLNFDCDKI